MGWCPEGPLAERILFPICRPCGRLVGYAGLDTEAQERWAYTPGLDPEQEVFGIERLYQDPRVRAPAMAHGVTVAADPLEVVRSAQAMRVAVVSPVSTECLLRPQLLRLMQW